MDKKVIDKYKKIITDPAYRPVFEMRAEENHGNEGDYQRKEKYGKSIAEENAEAFLEIASL